MALRPSLLTQTRSRIDERDSDNSHFTDSELYEFINQAIRFLGTDLEWPLQLAQADAVSGQAVYTLPTDFISLTEVFFDNRPLVVIDRADLKTIAPTWQDTDSGDPIYAYKQDNRKFGVYPKPNDDNDGLAIQIQYIKLPADLSDDVTSPDIHSAMHDCIPFYAAYLAESDMGNSKRADKMFDYYITHKKILQSKVQRFSDSLLRFRWG